MRVKIIQIDERRHEDYCDNCDNYGNVSIHKSIVGDTEWAEITEKEYSIIKEYCYNNRQYLVIVDQTLTVQSFLEQSLEWQRQKKAEEYAYTKRLKLEKEKREKQAEERKRLAMERKTKKKEKSIEQLRAELAKLEEGL